MGGSFSPITKWLLFSDHGMVAMAMIIGIPGHNMEEKTGRF
jgi:hypothetical protein